MTQHVVPNAARGGLYAGADGSALDDLVRAADAHARKLSAGTVRRGGGPDALARVRGNARPALERVNQEWDQRIAADRADADRKFLTKEGIAHREEVLQRMREEAVEAVAAPFLRELAQAERDVDAEVARAERPPVGREELDDAVMLASQLRAMPPSAGLPWVARLIAEAAETNSGAGVVRELLPHLRGLHDGQGAYAGDDDLKVVIHQAGRLLETGERALAEDRAGLLARTEYGLTELIKAAKAGDSFPFRTTTRDGEGGERPAILGDGPVLESSEYDVAPAWGDRGFRRIDPNTPSQRAADEAALAESE